MEHEIIRKEDLNSKDYLMEVKAPMVSKKIRPGQFVVLMTHARAWRAHRTEQKRREKNEREKD